MARVTRARVPSEPMIELGEVVAAGGLHEPAAGGDDLAGAEDRLEAEDVVAGDPVLDRPHPAGVGGDVAPEAGRLLARGTPGRPARAGPRAASSSARVTPGCDHGHLVGRVDLEDGGPSARRRPRCRPRPGSHAPDSPVPDPRAVTGTPSSAAAAHDGGHLVGGAGPDHGQGPHRCLPERLVVAWRRRTPRRRGRRGRPRRWPPAGPRSPGAPPGPSGSRPSIRPPWSWELPRRSSEANSTVRGRRGPDLVPGRRRRRPPPLTPGPPYSYPAGMPTSLGRGVPCYPTRRRAVLRCERWDHGRTRRRRTGSALSTAIEPVAPATGPPSAPPAHPARAASRLAVPFLGLLGAVQGSCPAPDADPVATG